MSADVPRRLTPSLLAVALRSVPDDVIRAPLWEWAPADRPVVIHERRRRFGIPDADDFDPEYN